MRTIVSALFILLFITIFMPWFSSGTLSSGDWVYYQTNSISSVFPFAGWDSRHFGLGATVIPTLWIESYFTITSKLSVFLSWEIYERIFWFIPIVLTSAGSSYLLARRFIKNEFIVLISPIIFLLNSYILLVISGGQVGVAMGYAITPLVILAFLRQTEISKAASLLFFALSLSVQMIFDIRFAYISLSAIFAYLVFRVIVDRQRTNLLKIIKMFIFNLIIPLLILLSLHLFWILPTAIYQLNPLNELGPEYNTVEAVKFFSFAGFENSISLLHPNWPENIFGKTGFMKIEFLLLPLLAFSSLLFLKAQGKNKNLILYFVILALIGAFLAKGTNDPFGFLYIFLFEKFPGFQMFRDSTKWYTLIALSYSVLIPFTVEKIYIYLKERYK